MTDDAGAVSDQLPSPAEDPWLDDLEAAAWRSWIRMSSLLRAQIGRDLIRESGLSESDYAVLVWLSEAEDHRVRMTDLAVGLGWSKSRLSHQVARMEGRELLRREECPSDARGLFAVLTCIGFREIHRAAPLHAASVREHFVRQLDRDQLEQLASISEAVLAHLDGSSRPCPANGTGDAGSTPFPD